MDVGSVVIDEARELKQYSNSVNIKCKIKFLNCSIISSAIFCVTLICYCLINATNIPGDIQKLMLPTTKTHMKDVLSMTK